MNILSLFDGMSCGQIALNRLGISYDKYIASEIDRSAIKVTQHNYPNTIQVGDVSKLWYSNGMLTTKQETVFTGSIELLLAGSPCQSWSAGGKGLGDKDPRGQLFWDMIWLLNETKPKYFLIENVNMKSAFVSIFSKNIGVEPILVNSALVSAQNRERLYWTNIPINSELKDRQITLNDIISESGDWFGAAYRRRYAPGATKTHSNLEIRKDRKANALLTIANKSIAYNKNTQEVRKFSTAEKEMLQTVPKGYTDCISAFQAHKMLANGWTVDVIAFLLSSLKKEQTNEKNI